MLLKCSEFSITKDILGRLSDPLSGMPPKEVQQREEVILDPCYSKCDPWSGSIRVAGELVRNEGLRPQAEPLIQNPHFHIIIGGSYVHESLVVQYSVIVKTPALHYL